jgi:putative transposase
LASWQARRKEDPAAQPPHYRKRFYRVQWKATAIRLPDGLLHLANARGMAPLVLPWPWDLPCQVELGWDGQQYELRATYRVAPPLLIEEGTVAGVDLGEVHLAVAHDGTSTTILNGGYVRSVRRYQNKLKAHRNAYIDRKKKGSRTCGQRYKPKGRMYRCRHKECGFVFHRDGVGALNIRQEYTGSGLVVGAMASPTGVHYHAHLRCSTVFG